MSASEDRGTVFRARESELRDIDRKLLARELAVSRQAVPSCDWSAIADLIVADRQQWERHLHKPKHAMNRELAGGLAEFADKGVIVHPLRLEPAKVAAIRTYLDGLPVYRGSHIFSADARLKPFAEVQADSNFAGYTVDQLLRAPHLVDFLNSPAIVDFLQAAMGCVPTLYSVNAWWSLPATIPVGHGMQIFHRDNDDWRFFTLFLYLTDVDEGAGPHQLLAGSQTQAGMQALFDSVQEKVPGGVPFGARESFASSTYFDRRFSDFVERHLADHIVNITGPAGTMFMANTLAVHRGLMPTKTPRLVVWARYGLGPNTNSVDLEQGPLGRFQVPTALPDTLRNRYVNRLLFEFDRGNDFPPEIPNSEAVADHPPAEPAGGTPTDDMPAGAPVKIPLPATGGSAAARSFAVAARTGARRNFARALLHMATSVFRR